ncbi:probable exonuclease 3'-5' domain-containing protein 2 [Coccomyxa sp. Obi]|nr:probable exonuclease 3'-5' domain-containing protein 2 [Coccomyxa sp. Obi]
MYGDCSALSDTSSDVSLSDCSSSPAGINPKWCSFNVTHPHLYWAKTEISAELSPEIPDGVTCEIVANPAKVGVALNKLYHTSPDKVFALDCEWIPNLNKGERHPVALLTIASASHVVLLRLCKMRLEGRLPGALIEFLEDPELQFLGTGWSSDVSELEHSYGVPRATWDRLIDLQKVVREMYPGQDKIGLKHLVWQFLGFWPPKGSEITLGDWEAPWLSRAQINYAILDALYVGEIFRWMRCIQARWAEEWAMRSWHTRYRAHQRRAVGYEERGEDGSDQAEALLAAKEAQREYEEQLAAQEEFEAEQRQLVLGMRSCSVY